MMKLIILMWYWSVPHVLCLSRVGWRTGTRPFWHVGAALSGSGATGSGWPGCAQRANCVLRWLAGKGGKSVASSSSIGGCVGNEVIPKRCQNDFTKCPVYYFTKQLQRSSSKTEASIEGNFKGKADDTEALCGLPMIEDCSYYSDSTDDEDSSNSDQKKGKKKKAHKGKKSSPSEKKDDKHKKGEKKGSDKKRDKKCQKKRKRHDSTSDSSSDKKKKGRKDKKEGKPHKTTKNAPKFRARAKRLAVFKQFKAQQEPQETSSSSSS